MVGKMLNENTDIVVARFNEDISWLNPIAKNCIIYNKGRSVPMPELYKEVIQLDNVGRESHTYLIHILGGLVKNKNKAMNDSIGVTIFIQGRIDDHIPKGIQPLDFVLQMIDDTTLTGQSKNADLYANINMRPSETLKLAGRWKIRDSHLTFGPWFRKFICVNDEGGGSWPMDDHSSHSNRPNHPPSSSSPIHTSRLSSHAPDLSRPPLNQNLLPWYMGAIFGARNDRIKQHPRKYYERLLNQVDDAENPEEAHYFERSWFYIFNNHRKTRHLL